MTTDTIGGVWTYTLELAAALGREGIEVILATMGRAPTDQQRFEAAEVPCVRLREGHFKLEWMDEPWEDLEEAGEWLLGLEHTFCPDVVHLNGYVHAVLPWKAPVVVVAHSCVLSWWKAVKGESAPPLWDWYREGVRAGLIAADLVVAPSCSMASTLAQFYGDLPRVRVIPNGRNPALFASAVKRPFIFSAGRLWDEAKNVALLSRVANVLSWPVYVAGEARQPNASGVTAGGLHPLGKLTSPALAEWLSYASIFALPAKYEPFGLAVLEAALSGCALVLGDIPTLRENWEGAARFVQPDDFEAFRSILTELISDCSARANLSACSQARALGFTHDRMASAYLKAYSEVVSRPGRRWAVSRPSQPRKRVPYFVEGTRANGQIPAFCRGQDDRRRRSREGLLAPLSPRPARAGR
jgi:glycogen(starch) synthase